MISMRIFWWWIWIFWRLICIFLDGQHANFLSMNIHYFDEYAYFYDEYAYFLMMNMHCRVARSCGWHWLGSKATTTRVVCWTRRANTFRLTVRSGSRPPSLRRRTETPTWSTRLSSEVRCSLERVFVWRTNHTQPHSANVGVNLYSALSQSASKELAK